MVKYIILDVRGSGTLFHLRSGEHGIGHITLVIYVANGLLAVIARLFIWMYATGKHRLVDSDVSPRLVKWDTVAQVSACVILVVVIGVSFISFIAAFALFMVAVLFHLLIVDRLLRRIE